MMLQRCISVLQSVRPASVKIPLNVCPIPSLKLCHPPELIQIFADAHTTIRHAWIYCSYNLQHCFIRLLLTSLSQAGSILDSLCALLAHGLQHSLPHRAC